MKNSLFCFSCKCSDLNLPLDGAEQQKIGFKGILTLPKPIQFKSSVKDCFQVNVLKDHFRLCVLGWENAPEFPPCPSGRVLHGDLCVHAASPAVALQRSGAAPADARPQEAHGGRGRPLAATDRLRGDGPLARPQPSVQISRESKLRLPGSTSQTGPCLVRIRAPLLHSDFKSKISFL